MDLKRNKKNDSNGTSELSMDVIHEILFRLPVESIMACRAVCKTWYAATKDPCFVSEVGKSRNQPSRIILRPSWDAATHLVLVDIEEQKSRYLPLTGMLQKLPVMCTCDGLLCLSSVKELNPAVIYNPITQETLILPPTYATSRLNYQQIGLGYDFSTQKYKVLRAFSIRHSKRMVKRYEILTLGETSWRKLSSPQCIGHLDGFEVDYCNGALYFTRKNKRYFRMIQFDLSDEKFRPIVCPPYFPLERVFLGLFDSGGSVVMAQGNWNTIELCKLTKTVSGDIYFSRQKSYDSHVKWASHCLEYISQMDPDTYLIQVGYLDRNNRLNNHLTQYFPQKMEYSCLNIPGIPKKFKAFSFKPSLALLPASPPAR